MDLAEWLLQQIAKDEDAARRCAGVYPPPWNVNDRGHSATIVADAPNFFIVTELDQRQDEGSDCDWLGERLEHIATWDPARILAECEAKRRIMEALQSTLEVVDDAPEEDRRGYRDVATGLGDAVRLLALPYADRPGYLAEWAP